MWKKTKEMKWKTAKLLWGDLFYDIAGAVLFAAGIYVCGKRRFCSRRNYGNISIAESCFRDSGRNTYSFYKSAPYRDQLSYTGETFSFENGEINGDHNIFS